MRVTLTKTEISEYFKSLKIISNNYNIKELW